MLVAGGVLNYADRQIIAVLKPMLQSDLHWTDLDYGRLTSVFQFASAVALIGSGWLVDRLGWRRANPWAVGAWSLAAMAHGLARTLSQFTLARLALGATEALGTPTAVKTIAAVCANEERALAFGVINAANTLGAILTPLAIPFVALRIGWTRAFLLTGGLGLIWVAVWLAFAPGGRQPDPLPADRSPPRESASRLWGAVLRDRRTWAIAGAKVLSDQVWWLLLFWMPDLFHRQFHLGVAAYGGPLAIAYACAAAGSLLGGVGPTAMLRAGWGLDFTRKTALFVAALAAVPVALVPHAQSVAEATALLGLTLAAHQAFSSNVFALATDIAPPARVATMVSVAALCGNLSGMLILQIAGWSLGAGHGYGALLGFASVSYVLAAVWIQLLLPKIIAAGDQAATL